MVQAVPHPLCPSPLWSYLLHHHRVDGGVFTVDLLIPKPAPPGCPRPRALVIEYVVSHRLSWNRPQYSGAILLRHHLLDVGCEMGFWDDIIYVDALAWQERRFHTNVKVWLDNLIKENGYDVLAFRRPRVQVIRSSPADEPEELKGLDEEEDTTEEDDGGDDKRAGPQR